MKQTQPESVAELFAKIEAEGRKLTKSDFRQAMGIVDRRMDTLLDRLDRYQSKKAGRRKKAVSV